MTDPLDLDALNAQQRSGKVHPYTCGVSSCRAVLVARADGWRCPACSYRQPFNPALIVISQPQNDLDALERRWTNVIASDQPHRWQDSYELRDAHAGLALLARLRAAEHCTICIERGILPSKAIACFAHAGEGRAERDALQARVTELETAIDAGIETLEELERQPDLAVDLAAFLNLTGETVADALRDLGYRLIVERDPSAMTATPVPFPPPLITPLPPDR